MQRARHADPRPPPRHLHLRRAPRGGRGDDRRQRTTEDERPARRRGRHDGRAVRASSTPTARRCSGSTRISPRRWPPCSATGCASSRRARTRSSPASRRAGTTSACRSPTRARASGTPISSATSRPGTSFVVRASGGPAIRKLADLCGRSVAVVRGTRAGRLGDRAERGLQGGGQARRQGRRVRRPGRRAGRRRGRARAGRAGRLGGRRATP